MKTVSFHNLGCKVNSYEMEVMQQKFVESGYIIVPFDVKADICVINTCTVTNIADRKSRQMLHRARKLNPDAVIVAVGCYVQALAQKNGTFDDPTGLLKSEGIDLCIGNDRKNRIVSIVEEYMDVQGCSDDALTDMKKVCDYEDMFLTDTAEHIRAYIKIQDGCDQFCTYCAIPYVRGRVRSRQKDSILKEIEDLTKKGYREFVITGIHLSSYGISHASGDEPYNLLAKEGGYTNEALIDIIKEVSGIEGVERIRLGSLEPRVITDEFLTAISKNEKVCPHFHLSLQSGCDSTLKRMNRRYTAAEYKEKTELIRRYYVNPAITTDIITGFPGEDEEEFGKTVEFVKSIGFYETHIFKYSKREGTVAASYKGQNTEAVKQARSEVLLELDRVNSLRFRKAHMGQELRIIAEEEKEIDGISYMTGYTDDYIMAAVKTQVIPGEVIRGRAVRMLNDEVLLLE